MEQHLLRCIQSWVRVPDYTDMQGREVDISVLFIVLHTHLLS